MEFKGQNSYLRGHKKNPGNILTYPNAYDRPIWANVDITMVYIICSITYMSTYI